MESDKTGTCPHCGQTVDLWPSGRMVAHKPDAPRMTPTAWRTQEKAGLCKGTAKQPAHPGATW